MMKKNILLLAMGLLLLSCGPQENPDPATPSVSTGDVSNITETTATCVVHVTSAGGSSVTARGVCWSTSQNPTISNSKTTDGSGLGSFTANMTVLSPNTTYYVRAYATNAQGTAYGSQHSFTTNAQQVTPTVTTGNVTNITSTTAICTGNVTSAGGSSVTARGVCWSTSQNPTISNSKITDGSGLGSFTANMTVLSPSTTYYVRAYATNAHGTAYGVQKSFTTFPATPIVVTGDVTDITTTTATCTGNVTSEGASSVISRGVCCSTSQYPTISDSKTIDGTGTGEFTSDITNLSPNTTYYVRAYATNSEGTAYGVQKTFNTLYETFIDSRDDKEYKILTIGSQVWLAENLAYIPDNVTVSSPADNSTTVPHYYVYDYSGGSPADAKVHPNYEIYGVLYNWPAAMNGASTSNTKPSGVQGACPAGWHLPSDAEWIQLEMYLGMTKEQADGFSFRGTDVGNKLKEAGTAHWNFLNAGATNSSGFTALPGGYIFPNANGIFYGISNICMFWTSTQHNNASNNIYRTLSVAQEQVSKASLYCDAGISIRCVMDYQEEPGSSPNYGTFVDQRDQKKYKTITIGGKEWMAENLAYLPSVSPPTSQSYDTPQYYIYGYDGTNVDEAKATYIFKTYGVLYNWPAAMNGASTSNTKPSGVQGACPAGWHLPSDAEWKDLEMYLGMTQAEADKEGERGTDEGGKLKHPWEEYWFTPNPGATNSSGFTALPGGYMYPPAIMAPNDISYFQWMVYSGNWWTSTQEDEQEAWSRYLWCLTSTIYRYSEDKNFGYSVRCLQD